MSENPFFEAKPTGRGHEMKVSLSSLPPEAWTYVTGSDGQDFDLWRKVPFMRRAVDVVSWGITQMPFYITRNGKTITDGSNYKDPTKGLLPNPRKNFSLICASLLLYGQAYQHIEKDALIGKIPNGLKWLKPSSVTPIIDKEGLKGFTRMLGAEVVPLTVDEVLHFWPHDPDVEVGPPLSSAADAALQAAGAAHSVDEFISMFFKRGAIKATVFTASNVLPSDQDKIKTWLDRMFSGLRGAFRPKLFNADKITPVVIGEGIESLENQELSKRLREDIATALGIPQSILFSNAANFAVSSQDYKNLFTLTIAPFADVISDTYNAQLLNQYGLSLEFNPESMDIFQEEENDRSGSLVSLLQAVTSAPPKVVTTMMQMLGMELPGEMQWPEFEAILTVNTPDPEPVPVPPVTPEPNDSQEAPHEETPQKSALYVELDKWERKALRALKAGDRARMLDFESEIIPASIRRVVLNSLGNASTIEEIKATFENLTQAPEPGELVKQFQQALEMMVNPQENNEH